jgi:rod shape-determining protein MreD
MTGFMPKGTRQLLLPASSIFIWFSLFSAFALNILLSSCFFDRASWKPDILLVVILFWSIHQNQRVGLTTGFLFGILMDVHTTSLLGQHALAYTFICFIAIIIHRRILWFKTITQALQLFPIFFMGHGIQVLSRYAFSANTIDWAVIVAPLLESFLWPIISVILLLPQKRSPDPDATRPL